MANANLGVKMFLENEVDSVLAQIENINETRKDVTQESLLKIIDEATIKNEKYNFIRKDFSRKRKVKSTKKKNNQF